jgi:hypothetical protein
MSRMILKVLSKIPLRSLTPFIKIMKPLILNKMLPISVLVALLAFLVLLAEKEVSQALLIRFLTDTI